MPLGCFGDVTWPHSRLDLAAGSSLRSDLAIPGELSWPSCFLLGLRALDSPLLTSGSSNRFELMTWLNLSGVNPGGPWPMPLLFLRWEQHQGTTAEEKLRKACLDTVDLQAPRQCQIQWRKYGTIPLSSARSVHSDKTHNASRNLCECKASELCNDLTNNK